MKIFTKAIFLFFIAISLNFLQGCASQGPNAMMDYAPVNKIKADRNFATITFVKNFLAPSFFGTPIGIYDKKRNTVDYVAHLDYGTRSTIKLRPGYYEFVLLGERDNIVIADIKANLNYYVDIRRGFSFLTETFHGVALNQDDLKDEAIKDKIKRASNCVLSMDSKEWFETKRAEFVRRFKNARKSFNKDGIIDKYAIVYANYGVKESFY